MSLAWYWRRLSRMSGGEVVVRLETAIRQLLWRPGAGKPALPASRLLPGARLARVALPAAFGIDDAAGAALGAYADGLLAGDWPVFETARRGVPVAPDWFVDPLTGTRAPQDVYCFAISHRRRDIVGDLKHVWEPSRHQATVALATAWWLTGEARYAEAVARQLGAWWRDNPYLQGIHWTSGIELGLRLLSWVWIRALLADWPGAPALFDDNPVFLDQLYGHQKYLAAFRSPASSANNHLLAELAGLAAAASAFPWFADSASWAAAARDRLCREALRQTAADGMNVEQASEYHRFVLELLWSAGLALGLAGADPHEPYWSVLGRMSAALRDSLDCRGREPRFGDCDGGRGLGFDAPATDAVGALLGAAETVFGEGAGPAASVFQQVVAACAIRRPGLMPAPRRGSIAFSESGRILLRAGSGSQELWLLGDCGKLGYLSIAAHGHADALSVELRVGGVDVLADPGTFLYHADATWRRYFKSTRAHNTLEVDGIDQAEFGGSFLWLSRVDCTVEALDLAEAAPRPFWQARHDGYRRLADPVTHHRRVTLDKTAWRIEIEDWLDAAAPHPVALGFHLGPAVEARLDGAAAMLDWDGGAAVMSLPETLSWSAHRGETDPPLGWYSRHYGHREPATVLIGRGMLEPGERLTTRIALHGV